MKTLTIGKLAAIILSVVFSVTAVAIAVPAIVVSVRESANTQPSEENREALTDGAIDPHDVLRVKGDKEAQEFLLNAIQEVYRLQGVTINDRHIEVIVRQMLGNVKILDAGDTAFLKGEIRSKASWLRENAKMKAAGKNMADAETILLGISKASLASESFISAASFQETTKVLTDAAITGQVDELAGLKENVIVGHLIPAGTVISARQIAQEFEQKRKETGEK